MLRGNYCCHRIDQSEVEDKLVSQRYRNKVQPESECNSKEHIWHRPSSSSNSTIHAPVEPRQSQHVNHTAAAEHRHFNRQRIKSKFGQLCRSKVDANVHQFSPAKIILQWKWLTIRNSVNWHDEMKVSRSSEPNGHLKIINRNKRRKIYHQWLAAYRNQSFHIVGQLHGISKVSLDILNIQF